MWQNIWLCHMGRASVDGTFEAFQEKVLNLKVELGGLAARVETPRGEVLSFGWEGPLHVAGQEQPLSGDMHYDSPYCSAGWPAPSIELHYGEYGMRLRFRS